MSRSQQTYKNKATTLHSKIVRDRGVCEKCGESEYAKLQCAHIVSRRYSMTRTRVDNAFCLCASCHMRFTEWPLEFAEFVIAKIGQTKYDELSEAANGSGKMDWPAEFLRLREIAEKRRLI